MNRLLAVSGTAFAALLVFRAVAGPIDPIVLVIGLAYAVLAARTWRPEPPTWVPAIWLLTPVILLGSPSGTELRFGLTAPDRPFWSAFAAVALLVAGATSGAALGVLLTSTGRRLPAPGPIGVALTAIVAAATLGVGWIGRAEVAADPDDHDLVIELADVVFRPNLIELPAGRPVTLRLENTGELPHTLTIDELGLDAYVPAGRWTAIDVVAPTTDVAAHCAIGDHADQGMQAVVRVTSP